MRTVIIQGSARSLGNTHNIIKELLTHIDADVIDLNQLNILPFDYEFKNQNDDFFPTIKTIIEKYDLIIFATPIYWYSMSGIMKNFFDRISDLLMIQKDVGRQLRGKKMSMISCSNEDDRLPDFNIVFKETAAYLGMSYLSDIHTWINEDSIEDEVKVRLQKYAQNLNSNN